ncbi:hypothetical protein ACTMU2_38085 [Cupriavidus basilensis]
MLAGTLQVSWADKPARAGAGRARLTKLVGVSGISVSGGAAIGLPVRVGVAARCQGSTFLATTNTVQSSGARRARTQGDEEMDDVDAGQAQDGAGLIADKPR